MKARLSPQTGCVCESLENRRLFSATSSQINTDFVNLESRDFQLRQVHMIGLEVEANASIPGGTAGKTTFITELNKFITDEQSGMQTLLQDNDLQIQDLSMPVQYTAAITKMFNDAMTMRVNLQTDWEAIQADLQAHPTLVTSNSIVHQDYIATAESWTNFKFRFGILKVDLSS